MPQFEPLPNSASIRLQTLIFNSKNRFQATESKYESGSFWTILVPFCSNFSCDSNAHILKAGRLVAMVQLSKYTYFAKQVIQPYLAHPTIFLHALCIDLQVFPARFERVLDRQYALSGCYATCDILYLAEMRQFSCTVLDSAYFRTLQIPFCREFQRAPDAKKIVTLQ